MTGLYTKLVSGVLFPLHERIKSHDTVRIRKAMEKSQWCTPAQIQEQRIERLREFLCSCRDKVPYYRDLFRDIGFDPQSVTGLEDLAGIPLLTKTLIRNNTDALVAETAQQLSRFNTGGSSGEPLIFFLGKERVSHDVAAKWRATRWWDVDIGDPEIVIWGSPIELGAQDRLRLVRDALLRTRLLPAFEMSDEKLKIFIENIRTSRPKMLFGYPSSISHIARYAEKNSIRMDDIGIKVAFVTSERLYDDQRTVIARVFGCKVANGYGGRDAGFIAHECPDGGMHITAEDIIVEIIDAQGNVLPAGEAGEVVITHMATGDFPFIRYRTGDVAVLDDQLCGCGRGLPMLKEIQGRTTDFIVASDGTVMHGLALIYEIRDVAGVVNFRIVQESLMKTVVQLVTDHTFDEDSLGLIRRGIGARLGSDVEVVVERVDAIAAEKSGKFRYVVSKVSI